MKKIGFIGAYDKTDLIIYIAKILTTLGKKVIVVDTTITQKAKYVVPAISPTTTYVTEFEKIDIAVGMKNEQDIKRYLGISEEQNLEYDFMFVDTDNIEGFEKFNLQEAQKNYFVTSFDLYSLKRGLEILNNLQNVTSLTKVLFSKDALKEDDDYLNFLSLGYKIVWNDEYSRIYFPIENGDLSVIYENQRVAKVRFKKLSVQYKDSLAYMSEEILGDASESSVRRAIKTIEKGV